jgi:TRAP-type mannitol/chloroaromatic compound transport system permease small subunit|tara:strand:+ start:907 stop:1461 length:555 start_codon:yes stop_codon:yes gene_type:complete
LIVTKNYLFEYVLKQLLLNITSKIDAFTEYTGKCISLLVIILVLLVGYDVLMRYLFSSGSIAIQELEWHLFSIIFLLGSAYTLKHDEHVRLDILYNSKLINEKMRVWFDILGTLLILLPFCLLIIISAWPFVMQAYTHGEISPDPGGLPSRWLVKAAIPIGFFMLLIQGISELLKKVLLVLEKN